MPDLRHLDGRRILLDERPLNDLFDAPQDAAGDHLRVAGANHAQLPKTGSELPLAGLIGLLSLAGAFGTRAVATVLR